MRVDVRKTIPALSNKEISASSSPGGRSGYAASIVAAGSGFSSITVHPYPCPLRNQAALRPVNPEPMMAMFSARSWSGVTHRAPPAASSVSMAWTTRSAMATASSCTPRRQPCSQGRWQIRQSMPASARSILAADAAMPNSPARMCASTAGMPRCAGQIRSQGERQSPR